MSREPPPPPGRRGADGRPRTGCRASSGRLSPGSGPAARERVARRPGRDRTRLPANGTASPDSTCPRTPWRRHDADRRSPGRGWRRAAPRHLPFADDGFDACVCPMALMLMGEIELVMAEIARVLSPGGVPACVVGGGPRAERPMSGSSRCCGARSRGRPSRDASRRRATGGHAAATGSTRSSLRRASARWTGRPFPSI
ncbi:class I SAM-dependent methyltransferase [Streptomyces sp. NPDC015171]|uniref:class I SAM-dependent methyltransferase n=1 Tax=Streptomyces sp. NPDC015171 TaxID=3364945 RepID=UPI0036FDD780